MFRNQGDIVQKYHLFYNVIIRKYKDRKDSEINIHKVSQHFSEASGCSETIKLYVDHLGT